MSEHVETHPLTLADFPHVMRLASEGMVLDTRLHITHGSANLALLASMMPHNSRHTLVARFGTHRAVGQFYMLPDKPSAQVVYLAPCLQPTDDDSAWLLVLDAMVREAGRRGANTLMAEMDENSPMFVTLRQSGFAVYARQQLYVLPKAAKLLPTGALVDVQPATDADAVNVMLLYNRTVPSLIQQVANPPTPEGFVYYEQGTLMGFVSVTEGRDGIYLQPYIDHRAHAIAGRFLARVAALVAGKHKRSVTVSVRRYQGWIAADLEALGFQCTAHQAVMVRHIAAGIHTRGLHTLSRAYSASHPPRKTERIPEVCIDVHTPKMEAMTHFARTTIADRVTCDGLPHTFPQRHAPRPYGGLPKR